jgi:hypothetical protein
MLNLKIKKMKNLGIVLIIIGIVMMVITGFNYSTNKKVLDMGRVEVNKEVRHPVQWSPIVGAAFLIGGIVVLLTSNRNRVV